MYQTETLSDLSDLIERMVIDTSLQKPRYIVVSHNKKYIQVSALVYTIMEKARAGHSCAAIAQMLRAEGGIDVTSDEIDLAYQQVLAKIQHIDGGTSKQQKTHWARKALISDEVVSAISSWLLFLFHPVTALVFLCSLTLLTAYAFEHGLLNMLIPESSWVVFEVYALFLFSLFMHEFGHATACLRGGVRPSEIGATIYLVFPALYSNVSASWALPRWKRVRVDTGGIYAQLCVGTLYLLLYLLSRQQAFQLAYLTVLGSCAVSLNPIVKFDGYWILSDLSGIANLSQQPLKLVVHCYHVLRKQPHKAYPHSWAATLFIVVYGLVRSGLLAYFLIFMTPTLLRSMAYYPDLLAGFVQHVQAGSTNEALMDLQILGGNALTLLIWSFAFYFLGRFCVTGLAARMPDTLAPLRQLQSIGRAVLARKRIIQVSVFLLGLAVLLSSSWQAYAHQRSLAAAYPSIDNLPCQESEQLANHYHAHLAIYMNDQPILIPKVGIGDGCYYWLHVHDRSGIIHIEAPVDRPMTLGNFFDLWQARFPHLQPTMPAELRQMSKWQAYVDGKLYSGDFHAIVFRPHLLITMAYNSPHVKPETIYNWDGV